MGLSLPRTESASPLAQQPPDTEPARTQTDSPTTECATSEPDASPTQHIDSFPKHPTQDISIQTKSPGISSKFWKSATRRLETIGALFEKLSRRGERMTERGEASAQQQASAPGARHRAKRTIDGLASEPGAEAQGTTTQPTRQPETRQAAAQTIEQATIADILKKYHSQGRSQPSMTTNDPRSTDYFAASLLFDLAESPNEASIKTVISKATGLSENQIDRQAIHAFSYKLASYVRSRFAEDLIEPENFKQEDEAAFRKKAIDTFTGIGMTDEQAEFAAHSLIVGIREKEVSENADQTQAREPLVSPSLIDASDLEKLKTTTARDMVINYYADQTSTAGVTDWDAMKMASMLNRAMSAYKKTGGSVEFDYDDFVSSASNNRGLAQWVSKAMGVDASHLDPDHILYVLHTFAMGIKDDLTPSLGIPAAADKASSERFRKAFMDAIDGQLLRSETHVGFYGAENRNFIVSILLAHLEQSGQKKLEATLISGQSDDEGGTHAVREEGAIQGGEESASATNGSFTQTLSRLSVTDMMRNYFSGNDAYSEMVLLDINRWGKVGVDRALLDVMEDLAVASAEDASRGTGKSRQRALVAKATKMPPATLNDKDVDAFCQKLALYMRCVYAKKLPLPNTFSVTDGGIYKNSLVAEFKDAPINDKAAEFVASSIVDYIKQGPSSTELSAGTPTDAREWEDRYSGLHIDLHSPDYTVEGTRQQQAGRWNGDYSFIKTAVAEKLAELKNQYREVVSELARSPREQKVAEEALVEELRKSGGVFIKAKVYDQDKEVDIYDVNMAENSLASSLDGYFDDVARNFYRDARANIEPKEGKINITQMGISIEAPRFVSSDKLIEVDEKYIQALGIRDKDNSYQIADPRSARGAMLISRFFDALNDQFKELGGDLRKSKTLHDAVDELLLINGKDPATASAADRSGAGKELLRAYYKFFANRLDAQQRLLVYAHPNPISYMVTQMGQYLGLARSEYYKLLTKGTADHSVNKLYSKFIEGMPEAHEYTEAYTGSLYQLFFDANAKYDIQDGLNGGNRDALFEKFKQQFKLEEGKEEGLRARFDTLFYGFDSDKNLPASLVQGSVVSEYKKNFDAYVSSSSARFRDFEIERLASLRADAGELFSKYGSNTDALFGQLAAEEKIKLDKAIIAFKRTLENRMGEVPTEPKEIQSHLLNSLRQIFDAIPGLGNVLNVFIDALRGDWESIGHDMLRTVANLITLLPEAAALGLLVSAADAGWSTASAYKNYLDAVERGNQVEIDRAAEGLELAGVGLMQSGAMALSAVVIDALGTFGVPAAGARPGGAGSGDTELQSLERESAMLEADTLQAPPRSSGVTGMGELGDVATEHDGRAIALQGSRDKTYMRGGRPYALADHQGAKRLAPLAKMSLEERDWTKVVSGSTTAPAPSLQRAKSNTAPRLAFDDSLGPDPFFGGIKVKPGEVTLSSQAGNHPVGSHNKVRLAIVDDKYVILHEDNFEPVSFVEATDSSSTFATAEGQTFTLPEKLMATPRYKQELKGKIVGKSGALATVELGGLVEGIDDHRTISGVLVPFKDGSGQELVVKAAEGVYYRVKSPVPGAIASDTDVQLRRISPLADPKRAWPGLYRRSETYRNSSLAHDDFALEIYFGTEYANEAFSRNRKWVEQSADNLRNLQSNLPPDVTDTDNPFYAVPIAKEYTILFAPRNRAKLVKTIIGGENSVYEQVNRSEDLAFAKQSIEAMKVDGAPMSWPAHQGVHAMRTGLKTALEDDDVAFMRVTKTDGATVKLYAHKGDRAVTVAGYRQIQPPQAGPSLISSARFGDGSVSAVGALVDHLGRNYDPGEVRSVDLFTLDKPDALTATRVFDTSKDGYAYHGVTYLDEDPLVWNTRRSSERAWRPVKPYESLPNYRSWESMSVPIDLNKLPRTMPEGFYEKGSANYIQLERDGNIYQVRYDPDYSAWKIVDPNHPYASGAKTAYVERIAGKWEVVQPKLGLQGGGEWEDQSTGGGSLSIYRPDRNLVHQAITVKDRQDNNALKIPADVAVELVGVPGAPSASPAGGERVRLAGRIFAEKGREAGGKKIYGTTLEVPESCSQSTEALISYMAGGDGSYVEGHAENGETYRYTVPNVEAVDSKGDTFNISTEDLEDTAHGWVGRESAEDYFGMNGKQALPKVGEGVAFIRKATGNGAFDYHFMACVGEIIDKDGKVSAVLMSSLLQTAGELGGTKNYDLHVYRSVDEMRDTAFPKAAYYSALVRPRVT